MAISDEELVRLESRAVQLRKHEALALIAEVKFLKATLHLAEECNRQLAAERDDLMHLSSR